MCYSVSDLVSKRRFIFFFFFFNDTATTEIYTLSLHDALPISDANRRNNSVMNAGMKYNMVFVCGLGGTPIWPDRKSTRLNSSHGYISYAVFCLKKKKKNKKYILLLVK